MTSGLGRPASGLYSGGSKSELADLQEFGPSLPLSMDDMLEANLVRQIYVFEQRQE